jgi:hypothetical protein
MVTKLDERDFLMEEHFSYDKLMAQEEEKKRDYSVSSTSSVASDN